MTFPVHACTHEPCNYVVGSINPIEGKVEFLVYDYLLNEDSVYAFLSMFLILFGEHEVHFQPADRFQ
jgi:hypothetical protein